VSVNSGNILDLTGFRSARQLNSRVFRDRCRYSCRTDRRSCSLIPAIVGFFLLALTILLLRRIFERKRPNSLPLQCKLWEVDLLADWYAPVLFRRRTSARKRSPYYRSCPHMASALNLQRTMT